MFIQESKIKASFVNPGQYEWHKLFLINGLSILFERSALAEGRLSGVGFKGTKEKAWSVSSELTWLKVQDRLWKRRKGRSTYPSRISCLSKSVHRPCRHRTREGSHSAVVNRRVVLYPSSHSEGKVSLANSREGFEGTLESNSMCTKEVRSVWSFRKSQI